MFYSYSILFVIDSTNVCYTRLKLGVLYEPAKHPAALHDEHLPSRDEWLISADKRHATPCP